VQRGHDVTAVSRSDKDGDILDPKSVAVTAQGHDVVISGCGPGGGDVSLIVKAAESLLAGLADTKTRSIAVGSAGGREIAPGKRVVDSPDFPPAWKSLALAHI